VRVDEILWYPRNVEKLWNHGIAQADVEDLIEEDN
jgi:hypothetical protein